MSRWSARLAAARGSIGWRLVAGFAAATVLAFAVLGALTHQALRAEIRDRENEAVAQKLQLVRHLLGEHRSSDFESIAHRLDDALTGQRELAVWISARDDRLVYGLAPSPPPAASGSAAPARWRSQDGRFYRLAALNLDAHGVAEPLRVVVGVDATAGERTLKGFRAALGLAVAASALLAAALALVATRIALRPVAAMRREVQAVGPGDGGARLDLERLPDELCELGAAFNAALDRLQQAYAQLASFSADVAHELRTPLANIAGSTEVWLSRERGAVELRHALQENLEDVARLRTIVNDMLFLARADRGERPERLAWVSLAAQAREVAEFHEAVLDERGLALRVTGDAKAAVDPGLLRRAISNLLDNAARHAAPRSTVEIRLAAEGKAAWIEVANAGEPVSVSPPERIFDRFVRGDPSRQSREARTGLGLAIVKAVAAMHGGQVRVIMQPPWTRIGFCVAVDGGQPDHIDAGAHEAALR